MNKSKFLVALILGFALSILTFSLPVSAKLYKWVDDNGVTHYGETIPPEYADKDRAELNQAGRIIKQEIILDPEERRAKEEADAKKREAEKAALEKRRHDRTLLSTYSNEKEIDLARSRSLQQLDAHINSIHSQLKMVGDNLTGLQNEADGYSKSKKPAPASLQEDLNETLTRKDKLQETLDKLEAEKALIDARYDADKTRYKELTGR